MNLMDQLVQFLYGAAVSPIAYLVLAVLIIGDAVLPILPSESLVIGMSSVLVHTRPWFLLLVWAVSLCAAWVGDNLAYSLGRTRLLSENRFTRRPRVKAVLDWSRDMLERRGSTIIIVGRFIPVARIAVNMMAGAAGFGRRRFMTIVFISSGLWASYSVVIGALAGQWFHEHPILGVVIAVAFGMILGPAVDWVLRKTFLRGAVSAKDAQRRATEEAAEGERPLTELDHVESGNEVAALRS